MRIKTISSLTIFSAVLFYGFIYVSSAAPVQMTRSSLTPVKEIEVYPDTTRRDTLRDTLQVAPRDSAVVEPIVRKARRVGRSDSDSLSKTSAEDSSAVAKVKIDSLRKQPGNVPSKKSEVKIPGDSLVAVKAKIDSLKKQPRKVPFSLGEKLEFKIYFEFVLGGDAVMEVAAVDTIDGRDCFRIVSTARSASGVDFFYKVRDQITSWQDIKGGFTRRYHKILREGKHHYDERVEYKPEKSKAYMYKTKPKVKSDTLDVEGHILDILSAFYEVRAHKLDVGQSVWIDVHDIDKRYNLEVKVVGRERVEVEAGTFNCIIVEPFLQSSGIFRKEGNLQIWLTDDERRIPVLMKSKLYFGRVWAKLAKYTQGKNTDD